MQEERYLLSYHPGKFAAVAIAVAAVSWIACASVPGDDGMSTLQRNDLKAGCIRSQANIANLAAIKAAGGNVSSVQDMWMGHWDFCKQFIISPTLGKTTFEQVQRSINWGPDNSYDSPEGNIKVIQYSKQGVRFVFDHDVLVTVTESK